MGVSVGRENKIAAGASAQPKTELPPPACPASCAYDVATSGISLAKAEYSRCGLRCLKLTSKRAPARPRAASSPS